MLGWLSATVKISFSPHCHALRANFFVWLTMYESRGVIVSFNLKWTFIWSILRCAKGTSIHEWPELTDRIQLIEAMRMCDNKQSKAAAVLK